jgi:multidrug efflux pump subunit AcrB
VIAEVMLRLRSLQASLPPGYQLQIGGEYDKTKSGFKNLAMVMAISSFAVFLALLFNSRTPSNRCWSWRRHLTG